MPNRFFADRFDDDGGFYVFDGDLGGEQFGGVFVTIELAANAAKLLNQLEPQYRALYLIGQADGAIPNGRRIIKQTSDPDDAHAVGCEGIVLSSIATPAELIGNPATLGPQGQQIRFGYFIAWDDMPTIPVMTSDYKITTAPV